MADLGALTTTLDALGPVSGPSALASYQPVAATRTSLPDIAVQFQSDATLNVTAVAFQALSAYAHAQARQAQFKQALLDLVQENPSPEERRVLVAEALDLASHRFDAWTTALVSRRLATLRQAQPTGVMIGAYGWVENLVAESARERTGGYVHAPSVSHAATAGVLKSAYLTHNSDLTGNNAFAVDLSSTRVRAALDVIQGVRAGQPLGALLGYRLERILHENKVDRFIYSLRALAPLFAGTLVGRGQQPPQPAPEAIAANDVVDAVKLLDIRAKDEASIRTALNTAPANNPYITAAQWPGINDEEWGKITAAMDATAEAYDAVADLMLAEGVHQLVQGNIARAAAALDAAAAGDAPPPDADMIRSPQWGTIFTQRVLLALPDAAAPGAGWATTGPRAVLEPRLDAWAARLLGPATAIVVHAPAGGQRVTLDAANLSALDVVFDSADRAVLEHHLRAPRFRRSASRRWSRSAPPTGRRRRRTLTETVALAAAMQRLLASARAATPASLSRPNDQATRQYRLADLTTRLTTLINLSATLNQTATDLGAALTAADQAGINAGLTALEGFGISQPRLDGAAGLALARAGQAEALRRVKAAETVHQDIAGPLAAPDQKNAPALVAAFGDMTAALFGDAFRALPLIEPGPNPDLFGAALAAPGPKQGEIRRFVRACPSGPWRWRSSSRSPRTRSSGS